MSRFCSLWLHSRPAAPRRRPRAAAAGLAEALKVITLQANHWHWANKGLAGPDSAKWAKESEDPAKAFSYKFQVKQTLANAGADRAKTSGANHLLYPVKANQLFTGGNNKAQLDKMRAPALIIYQTSDQIFPAASGVAKAIGRDRTVERRPQPSRRRAVDETGQGGDRGLSGAVDDESGRG